MPSHRRLHLADPTQDARIPSLEDLAAVRVVRIAELVSRLATRHIEVRFGLRNTDLRILNILDANHGVSVSDIGRKTRVDKAWISRSIRHLESSDLVTRRGSKKDSRVSVVSLTRKGRTLLDEVRPLARANETRMLDGIDVRRFKRELDRLLANVEAMLEALS